MSPYRSSSGYGGSCPTAIPPSPYYLGRSVPRSIDCDSFMLIRMNIEPGQVVDFTSTQMSDEWHSGTYFTATNFIYVGTPSLWVLKNSSISGYPLWNKDIPCDTFRPGCPTSVNWSTFSILNAHEIKMYIENRGKEIGHLIARLAGAYYQQDPNYGYRP